MAPIRAAALAAAFLIILPGLSAARSLTFDDFIAMGRVSDPRVSPDGSEVAFVVEHQNVETNKRNKDIYLIPMKGGDARRLTESPASDTHPRFSPDGRWLAFQSSRSGKAQVWVISTSGGEARQITRLSTGATAPEWLPDGESLIFRSRVYPDCLDDDCNRNRDEAREDSQVEARIYDKLMFRHWDEWRDEKRSHIFRIGLDGSGLHDMTPGDTDYPTFTLGSGHDVAVSPDGTELCVAINTNERLERNINNDLYIISLPSGDQRPITSNEANDNGPVYSHDGRYIAYRAMSLPGFEADRYRLMVYDRESGEITDLSGDLADRLDRSVRDLAWTPDGEHLLVTCADRGMVSLYRVAVLDGKAEQLTEGLYVSSPVVSPTGRAMVFLAQNERMPYEVFRTDRRAGAITQLTHINDERLAELDMNEMETFVFEGAGGTAVHGFLLTPPDFDRTAKYPLLYLIHGGPQGAWSANFHWRWNYQMFAAPGYVVVAVNPRGSTGYGQRFTDEISRDWGGKAYEDLMKGLDYVLETYPFIDGERLAAAGASYGGYMISWIAGHTDRFRCLVNHDGVYNFTSFYGTTEELWFPEWDLGSTPWENREGYARFSPHMFAENFRTPMLVIHGGKDYRVDPSEGFQLFTTLQRLGVPSKLLYYPDEGHWVLKPQNARLWWATVHDWLAEWLE